MTDHDERERLAAWCVELADWAAENNGFVDEANYHAIARLLREPVNARLRKWGERAYELSCYTASFHRDGRPNEQEWIDGLRERIEAVQQEWLAIAVAASAPSKMLLASVLAYDAGRDEQAAEVSRLTARIKELGAALDSTISTAHQHEIEQADVFNRIIDRKVAAACRLQRIAKAELARLRAAPRVGVEAKLVHIIRWALGEEGDFPLPPDDNERPRRRYWWRTEMRKMLNECWPAAERRRRRRKHEGA